MNPNNPTETPNGIGFPPKEADIAKGLLEMSCDDHANNNSIAQTWADRMEGR